MKKLPIYLPMMVLFFFQISAIHSQHSGDSSSADRVHELRLNDGEKWKIDADMVKHIRIGEDLLNEFIKRSGTDYSRLAKELSESNNQLIFSCSMTGEAHDLLHKWLHPHLELTAMLQKADDPEAASKLVYKMKDSYENFNTYFQ